MNYTEIINEMATNTMLFVARRIAKLSLTDAKAAQNDYEQHCSTMSADEKSEFLSMLIVAKTELGEG